MLVGTPGHGQDLSVQSMDKDIPDAHLFTIFTVYIQISG